MNAGSRPAKAQAALETAKGEHEEPATAIKAEIEAPEEKAQAEGAAWDKEKGAIKRVAARRTRSAGSGSRMD